MSFKVQTNFIQLNGPPGSAASASACQGPQGPLSSGAEEEEEEDVSLPPSPSREEVSYTKKTFKE